MSAFLFTFFLLARVSNIVPGTSASFNPSCTQVEVILFLPLRGSFYSSTLRLFSSGNSVFYCLYYICRIPFVQYSCLSVCVPLSQPLHRPSRGSQVGWSQFLNRNTQPFSVSCFVAQVSLITFLFRGIPLDGGPPHGPFIWAFLGILSKCMAIGLPMFTGHIQRCL